MKRHWVTSGTVDALLDRIVRHPETCARVQSAIDGCVGIRAQVILPSCVCCNQVQWHVLLAGLLDHKTSSRLVIQ
jgi:hypothetical protein